MKHIVLVLLCYSNLVSAQKIPDSFSALVSSAVFSLSKVMMHDVVNPPAASRYYAYCMLGAYEIASKNDAALPPLSTFTKNYKAVSIGQTTPYNSQVAALYCILETGRLMLPSGYMLKEDEDRLLALFRKRKIRQDVIERSVLVAAEVAKQIIEFSRSDHYNQLSARVRYSPIKSEGSWYPTPPAYMEAVEPHWKTIRTLIIDSCNEFIPPVPVTFSKDSSSAFYKLAREVYEVSSRLSEEQQNIAAFWDCNPFAVSTSGHMAIGFKKISPGGHWMHICGIVSRKAQLGFGKTVLLHTILSATIMDAFISCWDEKYRSNRIRPETYINRYIDVRWQPFLQTPPFPEYTSGHSIISTASAEVLTYLLGEQFSFTDDSELMFDLPPRSFASFHAAASEASISRLYGGIHFRDSIENAQQAGRSIGLKIISKIKAAGIRPE